MDKARNEEILAISFAKWIKENYSIVKGGKYRHRGDFFRNAKPIDEMELFKRFIEINNEKETRREA